MSTEPTGDVVRTASGEIWEFDDYVKRIRPDLLAAQAAVVARHHAELAEASRHIADAGDVAELLEVELAGMPAETAGSCHTAKRLAGLAAILRRELQRLQRAVQGQMSDALAA